MRCVSAGTCFRNSIPGSVSARLNDMLNENFFPRLWSFIREYLVVIVLLVGTCKMFFNVYVTGTGPAPQQPPESYTVEQTQATFQWDRGNRTTPITLQVSQDSKSFETLVLDRKITGTTHTMNNLEPGHTYYWRLVQGDETSPVASFKTAKNAVNF